MPHHPHAMADCPALRRSDSTLCLRVETKASPLLGNLRTVHPSTSTHSSTPTCTPTSAHSSTSSCSSGSEGSERVCYICHCDDGGEPLLRNVCGCKKQAVHPKCLATWLHYSAARRDGAGTPHCEVCLQRFDLPISVTLRARLHSPTSAVNAHRAVHPSWLVSVSVPSALAFVYGFSFSSLATSFVSIVYTCAIGNLVVIAAWLLFVVGRGRPAGTPRERRVVEDVLFLLCVYIMFLAGWALQEWSLPRYARSDVYTAVHFVNAGCMVGFSVLRLAYAPCRALCQLLRAPAPLTITLDVGDS